MLSVIYLSVTYKPIMLSVIILIVVMLSVIKLIAVMLSVMALHQGSFTLTKYSGKTSAILRRNFTNFFSTKKDEIFCSINFL